MQQFNPIQSKLVVAMQMRSVGLLQQSIPVLIAALYIMVQILSSSSSQTDTWTFHAFINYVRATSNHDLSPS